MSLAPGLPHRSLGAALVLLAAVAPITVPAPLSAQLRPDPDFDPAVDEPTYQTDGPRVLFDEAHHNIHTSTGSYSPFVELIRNDGYRVTANREPFTRPVLDPYDVLVIASARGGPPRSEQTAEPAFTDAENAAVRQWVRDGGSLLLITDHTPNTSAAAGLAAEFGVHIADATTLDTIRYHGGRGGGIVFARGHGTLRDHPITVGRGAHERIERVVTFSGSSLAGPDGSHLLVLSPSALDRFWAESRGDTTVAVMRSAAGRAQAAAFPFGRGRVAVMGEAGAFTSVSVGGRQVRGMDEPGFDNRQLVLNTMHWLSGLLPATAEPRPHADPAFDPTVEEPAFVDEATAPRALFDEAHFNTYTADARYRPFVDLMRADGIRVDRGVEPLAEGTLADYDVLVVAGPRNAQARCEWTQWTTVERCAAARPAFRNSELDAIEAWVRAGGGLLLAADPFPEGLAARELAARFGVEFTGARTTDPLHSEREISMEWIRFSREDGTLLDHPVTLGRTDAERVRTAITLGGGSLRLVPPAADDTGRAESAVPFLRLPPSAFDMFPGRLAGDSIIMRFAPAADLAHGIALEHGRGRVVILGDADMLTAQLLPEHEDAVGLVGPPAFENRRLALNIVRWVVEGQAPDPLLREGHDGLRRSGSPAPRSFATTSDPKEKG